MGGTMSITLNGTTGITTPDLTSAAPMDVGGSAVLTAASSLAAANLTGNLTLGGALNNVTSIDATTAASFAAGGVGGSTVKLVDSAAITAASTWVIPFTGTYDRYIIKISGLRISNTGDLQYIYCRLTDSSYTPITSPNYVYHNNGAISSSAWGTAFSVVGNRLYTQYQGQADLVFTIDKPLSTTEATFVNFTYFNTYVNPTYRDQRDIGFGTVMHANANTPEIAHYGLYFFPDVGTFLGQGKYTVWGVK